MGIADHLQEVLHLFSGQRQVTTDQSAQDAQCDNRIAPMCIGRFRNPKDSIHLYNADKLQSVISTGKQAEDESTGTHGKLHSIIEDIRAKYPLFSAF